uniref:Membrane transporter n=1 Tax=Heterorhabditis bacteriophora TaxID=37862 RepID=A0A1I7XG62_HETBA
MSTTLFELFSIVLLGLGQMCIMTGYDTQAICYAAYMGACLIAPLVLHILSPKWTLFLSSVCYTLYHIGFFYLNNYYYYISCAIMGVGFALFYTGHGAFLTSHSTRETIQQNSALAWSIACMCMLVGSATLAIIFSITDPSTKLAVDSNEIGRINSDLNVTHDNPHSYRQFADREIYLMYGTFTAISICANIIFILIPSREISNCIEGKNKKNTSFYKEMVGAIITCMSYRIPDFGLRPTMAIGFCLSLLIILFITASVPAWSTVKPNNDVAWLIQPSFTISITIAFAIGMADSCVNNTRNVICALAMPERRPQTYAISKFYQNYEGNV